MSRKELINFSIFILNFLEAWDEIKPYVPASCGLVTQWQTLTPPIQRKYYECSPARQHEEFSPINRACLLSRVETVVRLLSITQRIMFMSNVKQEICLLAMVSTWFNLIEQVISSSSRQFIFILWERFSSSRSK